MKTKKEIADALTLIKNVVLDAKTHVKDDYLIAALDRVLEAKKLLDVMEADIRERIREAKKQ